MVVVVARARVRPECRSDAASAAARVTEATRREPGCRSYTFFAELEDPCALLCCEEWDSDEALAAHFRMEHVKDFLSALGKMLDGEVEILKYGVSTRERI